MKPTIVQSTLWPSLMVSMTLGVAQNKSKQDTAESKNGSKWKVILPILGGVSASLLLLLLSRLWLKKKR